MIKRPYYFFLAAFFMLLVYSFFVRERIANIHVHDSMFIIRYFHIALLFAALCLLFWFIYLLLQQLTLYRSMIWLHVFLTLLFIIVSFVLLPLMDLQRSENAGKDVEAIIQHQRKTALLYLPFIFFFMVAQILFVFNVIGGLLRKFGEHLYLAALGIVFLRNLCRSRLFSFFLIY